MKLKAHHPNSGTIVCPQSSLVLGGVQVKKSGCGTEGKKLCFSLPFRSSLPEGALLEGNTVCYCTCSWTPGCLDHLLQLAAPKTSRCRIWAAQDHSAAGTQADQNGEKWNQGPTFQGWDCLPPVSPCSHQNSQKKTENQWDAWVP